VGSKQEELEALSTEEWIQCGELSLKNSHEQVES